MARGAPSRPGNRGKRTRMSKAGAIITPDKFHDECAVVGVYGHKEAANLAYLSLYALQHRGQESSGIVSNDGEQFHWEKGMGLVADVFTRDRLKRLPGRSAIGHNRYSTAGSSDLKNAQPLVVNFAYGNLALAHNGNLINAQMLRNELEAYGAIFQSTSDSEVIVHLIAQSKESLLLDRIFDALNQVRGAFSITLLTDNGLIAARDPWGFRPLCLGRIKEAWVIASETCAFDLIGADAVRDVEPGQQDLWEQRVCRPQGAGPSARQGIPRAGRHRDSGARLGRAGGAGVRRRGAHSVRAGPHPQPLRGPDLHRTGAAYPALWRQGEAERR